MNEDKAQIIIKNLKPYIERCVNQSGVQFMRLGGYVIAKRYGMLMAPSDAVRLIPDNIGDILSLDLDGTPVYEQFATNMGSAAPLYDLAWKLSQRGWYFEAVDGNSYVDFAHVVRYHNDDPYQDGYGFCATFVWEDDDVVDLSLTISTYGADGWDEYIPKSMKDVVLAEVNRFLNDAKSIIELRGVTILGDAFDG